MFESMRYQDGVLDLVDQRVLPRKEVWFSCSDLEQVAAGIEDMVVRGAPAIGCAAGFAFAIDARKSGAADWASYQTRFDSACERLGRTRPTAVNLFNTIDSMKKLVSRFQSDSSFNEFSSAIEEEALRIFREDIASCKRIGDYGAKAAPDGQLTVLTHCNAGALATAGYGTALGVIRSLHKQGRIKKVYVDETRPWLQGARLTAYELFREKIPCELIVDSVSPSLMAKGLIDMVVTGADRIAANGDTANKIGTYSLAVSAAYHKVPFFIAAPVTTFDFAIATGAEIEIENRSGEEIAIIAGTQISPEGMECYNPSFDVTPAEIISGIITEKGVFEPPYTKTLRELS